MKQPEGHSVVGNMDYSVFSDDFSAKMNTCVFNIEYRVLQKMKRIHGENHLDYRLMMRELLASANGATVYEIFWETLLNHGKEYRKLPESFDLIPMTLIAWRTFSGCIVCSVERIFLKWDSALSLEDNLFFNAYMEHSGQVVSKLLKEHYEPVAVIGKGDYIRTLRKVFADQFGYTVI